MAWYKNGWHIKRFLYGGVIIAAASLSGCGTQPGETLFVSLPAAETGIDFVNRIEDSSDLNIFNYRNFYHGGGVAIGDINNDGLADIFMVSNMEGGKLYLNKGGLRFEDITTAAGVKGRAVWSTGATFADVNGDGLLDIYLCHAGNREHDDRSNELFINNGDLTFTEAARTYGLADTGLSIHAAFFDYDRDGDLDMYLLNNSFIPIDRLNYQNLRQRRDPMGGHKFFRNDGSTFTDVSEAAGIYGSVIGFGLGITVGDVNDDNWPDIYISNDFYERDYLYINNHNGTFTDRLAEAMPHISLSSMGADIADINNDGTLDVFVTDMLPGDDARIKQTTTFESPDLYQLKLSRDYHHQITQNTLQLNNGDGTFSEVARMAGVEATDWSWGALVFDMDNDGWKDIFVANGILRDLTDQDFVRYLADKNRMEQMTKGKKFDFREFIDKMPSTPQANCAFRNLTDLRFVKQTTAWGLDGPGFSNGAAYGDLDNDGDYDLVVNNLNSTASVFRNTAADKGAHSLRVKLSGSGGNRNGIGTKVQVYQQGKFQYLQQMPNRGFESSVDHTLIFGLGNDTAPLDSVVVIWPDDNLQVFRNVAATHELVVDHKNADRLWQPEASPTNKPFMDVTAAMQLNHTHRENHYVDYYRDPLLKQMYSTQGPALTTGDVNGDGLEDVITGGAKGEAPRLFIQQKEGVLAERSQHAFTADSLSEDVAAVLTDIDSDADLDLFVVTGSNEFDEHDVALKDRLYINDGKGNFEKSDRIPSLSANGSCVAAEDFDRDGDVDLFIGSRLISGRYGLTPASYLYVNDGKGNFKNQTKRYLPSGEIGMITDAVWADIDGDSYPELITVGDWMPITIFKNEGGKALVPWKKPLRHAEGWWNCITPADIDRDGDIDFIIGNLGYNSRIRADSLHPAELYVGDFDNNGAVEQVIASVAQDGKNYPMMLKHDLERQLPVIKRRFLNYADYAGKSVTQILTAEELKRATVKQVSMTGTCLMINEGNGDLSLRELPRMVQLSPVHAIVTLDYDHDGNTDILLGGNFFDVLPELGRYDASYGVVLHGTGKGAFEVLSPRQSGFFVKGQVRQMRVINFRGKECIIVARNNDRTLVFEANAPQDVSTPRGH